MSEKVWTALYLGKEIRVSSRTSWLPAKNRQTLTIDGRVIALQQKGWRSIPACLRAPYQFEDQELWVEVLIGYSGLRRACHIYVDGELVGGDTPKKIRALTYQQWQEIQRKGLGRFLLVRGLLCMGLPFALALLLMTLMELYPSGNLAVSFIYHSLVFGLGMGGYFWWAMKKAFEDSV